MHLIVCFFADRAEVVNTAISPDSGADPSRVLPSWNVTISPSGILPKREVTAAVKVTGWPTCEGDCDVVTRVIVPYRIISVSGADVLLPFLLSPEYVAVMVCVPTTLYVVVNAA